MSHLSASFSATLRVRLPDAPGSFARVAQAIGDAGGLLGAIDLVRVEQHEKVRDVTVQAASAEHLEAIVAGGPRGRGRRRRARLRPHVPAPPRRQDRGRPEDAAQDARRPLDGLHAGRRADLPGDRRRPRRRVEPDDQEEHGRGRLRRHRGARARRHRPGGGDAGDGGQGDPVQGVRRRRCVARSASRRRTSTRSSRSARRSRRRSAASTSRTSPRRAASRSSERLRDGTRHPRVPRRPARHGDRDARRARQRTPGRRQADRGREDRDDRRRCRRASRSADILLARRRAQRDRLPTSDGAVYRGRHGLTAAKAAFAERSNPDNLQGTADELLAGADVFIGLSVAGAVSAGGVRTMAKRRDRVRDGEPDARGRAGGDRGARDRRGDRALRLPEPDQQRARLPRRLPRRARRARDARSPRG